MPSSGIISLAIIALGEERNKGEREAEVVVSGSENAFLKLTETNALVAERRIKSFYKLIMCRGMGLSTVSEWATFINGSLTIITLRQIFVYFALIATGALVHGAIAPMKDVNK